MAEVALLIVGDDCRQEDCCGIYELQPSGDCTCHIKPPCGACENARLRCDACGDEP